MKTLLVEIRPDRIGFVLQGGRSSARSAVLDAKLPANETAWCQELLKLAPAAAEVIQRLKASGASARVVYRSPSDTSDLSTEMCDRREDALEVSSLRIADSLPDDRRAIIRAMVINSSRSDDQRCHHVLTTGDRSDIAEAIVQFVTNAGLRFRSATPLEPALTVRVAEQCRRTSGQQTGLLYVGAHSALFLVGGNGEIDSSRRVSLGFEQLVKSLTRPIRVDDTPVTLTADRARAILCEYGLPAPDVVVDKSLGLTGRQILPQLQPKLQRAVVEIRQTLRFGLPEEAIATLEIQLVGPGATISGLAELLATELEISVVVADPAVAVDWEDPASRGSELRDAAADVGILDQLNVEPPQASAARHARRLRGWLIHGAAAALALVAFDAIRYDTLLVSLRQQAQVLSQQTEAARTAKADAERLRSALTASNSVEVALHREIARRADIAACLRELALLTPSGVSFTSVSVQSSKSEIDVALDGFAALDQGARVALADFVDTLNDSALFNSVRLGGVQLGSMNGTEGSRFQMTMDLYATPAGGFLPANAQAHAEAHDE